MTIHLGYDLLLFEILKWYLIICDLTKNSIVMHIAYKTKEKELS